MTNIFIFDKITLVQNIKIYFMKNYLLRIKKIKNKFTILKKESFIPASNGTNYKVFISNNYVIRFRDDNTNLLLREVKFLKQLDHVLIPKILWFGEIDKLFFMVENRLPGKTMNLVWKNLSENNKNNIIKQIIQFLQYQKTQTKNYIYSVKTGKKYKIFIDYFMDGIKQKITTIKKHRQADNLLKSLLLIINNKALRKLFSIKSKVSLVHGDLITHNLLTNNKKLTGVIDWESASWGNPEYDLYRLFYYHECAKAYKEQGIDETFEYDYMNKLITKVLQSDLIKNKKIFKRKYQFAVAIFYLNALHWAVNSNNPKKNIDELIKQWDKKSEIKYI